MGIIGAIIAIAGYIIPVPPAVIDQDEAPCSDTIEIYVVDRGVHTGIITPLNAAGVDWSEFLDPQEINPVSEVSYNHLEFGWGEERFYINTPSWKDLRLRNLIPALFWPTSSAMHVSGLRYEPVSGNMRRLEVNECHYRKMTDFIRESFYLEEGELQYITEGYGRHDGFYVAEGRYHLFRTCNDWAADAINKAGFETPFWPLFPSWIMRKLD